MAAPANVDVDINHIECPVCLDVFEHPMSLPCTHTYCRSCIDQIARASSVDGRRVRCPECRRDHRVDSVRDNTVLARIVDSHRSSQRGGVSREHTVSSAPSENDINAHQHRQRQQRQHQQQQQLHASAAAGAGNSSSSSSSNGGGAVTLTAFSVLLGVLSDRRLRKTLVNVSKAGAITGGGAVVGGMLAGPPGALIGGIVGSIVSFVTTDDYDSFLVSLNKLPARDRNRLVAAVNMLLTDNTGSSSSDVDGAGAGADANSSSSSSGSDGGFGAFTWEALDSLATGPAQAQFFNVLRGAFASSSSSTSSSSSSSSS